MAGARGTEEQLLLLSKLTLVAASSTLMLEGTLGSFPCHREFPSPLLRADPILDSRNGFLLWSTSPSSGKEQKTAQPKWLAKTVS